MQILTKDVFGKLIEPKPRLPWIMSWLLEEIWTTRRFKAQSPEAYLTEGEEAVHAFEEALAASADQFYDELASASVQLPGLLNRTPLGAAVVVFDGASLREIPILLKEAKESGYRILECSVSLAAVPSTTTAFVLERLLGKEATPKSLPQRRELKEKGIRAYYFDDPISTHQISPANGESILIWSAFPDITYQDSDSRFARHFAGMQKLYDTVWKNTVMQVPRGRRIVITSDHGYIFFGAGFDSTRPGEVCEILDQDRYKFFGPDENLPNAADEPSLQIFPDKRLAMVRGRIKNRPKGPAANRVYRHGGLSLMEMLVPWIVLEKE